MNVRHWPRRSPRVLALALVLSACSGGGDATSPANETKNPNEVGPAGGVVTTQDKRVSLDIPAGAVSKDIVITVNPISNPTNDARVADNSVYELGPDGTQFAQPVTLQLAYDPGDLPPGTDMASLRIATYADGEWKDVDNITVDSVKHTVSGQIHHFSKYGVKADPCAPMAHEIGTTSSGAISRDGSCLYPDGPKYSDYYDITMTSEGALTVDATGIDGTFGVKDYNANPSDGLVWAYSPTGTALHVALGAGTYQIFFSGKDTTVTGDYSFTSSLSAQIGNPPCTPEFVALQPGTSNTATLGASSCDIVLKYAQPSKYNGESSKADYYAVKLAGGKSYTVSATILTPGTNIALTVYSQSWKFLDLSAGSQDQNPKTLTVSPQADTWIYVEVSASTVTDDWHTTLGSYRLEVSG